MQRPEEKKHPSTLDPQEFLYHGLGLAVFGDGQVTGTRFSSPWTRLFLMATPRLQQRISLPGRRHGRAGMEACIAKGGCKGYISAGSRPRRMASSPVTSWVGSALEVFFCVCPFLLLLLASSDHTLFPIRLYSLLFWFVFIQQKIAARLAVEYRGRERGRRGVGGTDRWDVVLFPHFFFTSNGASAVSWLPEGVQRRPRQERRQRGQLLMVQSETQPLISEPWPSQRTRVRGVDFRSGLSISPPYVLIISRLHTIAWLQQYIHPPSFLVHYALAPGQAKLPGAFGDVILWRHDSTWAVEGLYGSYDVPMTLLDI